jgi:hypothetical protein
MTEQVATWKPGRKAGLFLSVFDVEAADMEIVALAPQSREKRPQ